jgi:hypothetical protein
MAAAVGATATSRSDDILILAGASTARTDMITR